MPGWSTADNKFGPSQFIVGPTLGDGVNYTSIQSAITDANAAGGGTVIIRAGSYVQSFSMAHNVSVVGASYDGESTVTNISGTVTVGFVGNCSINGISVTAVAGTALDITAGASGQLEVLNCSFSAAPGNFAMVGNSAALSAHVKNCNFVGLPLTTNCAILLDNSLFENCLFINGSSFLVFGGNPITVFKCRSFSCAMETSAGNLFVQHSYIGSGAGPAFIIAGGSQIFSTNTVIESQDASGFAVQGTGTLAYSDLTFSGTAENIDVTVTQAPVRWRPHGTAGTSVTAYKGTAGFDSTQFTVTDGFVQLAGTPSVFTWVDQPASTTVPSNQGNFFVGTGITLTLPPAPAQGDTCKFKCATGGVNVIQANGAQALVTGSVATGAGGTTTSSAIGDAMELTFYAAGNYWIADSIIGVWTTI